MTEDRKGTIINELNYWKKNKMLPAVYCDYLLALYTNGEEVIDDKEIKSIKFSILKVVQLILLTLLLPFALLVIYTSYFPNYLQIATLLIFILYSFWHYKGLIVKQNLFYHLSLIIFLLLIFLTTIFLCNTYFYYLQWVTLFVMIMNFLVWIIIGSKMELKYLSVTSIFGILLVVLFFVL